MDMRQRPRFDPFYEEQLRSVMTAWHGVLGRPSVAELWQVAVEAATAMFTFPASDDEDSPRDMWAGLLHRAMGHLVGAVVAELPALFHVYQQKLWTFVGSQVIAAAGHPELAEQIYPQRFYHWFPDNPISRTPEGDDIVPPDATEAHIDQLKAHRRAEQARETPGRPLGTGYYEHCDQLRADIVHIICKLIEKHLNPTQANVADHLPYRMSTRWLQALMRRHGLRWANLQHEARHLPHDMTP